MLNMSNNHSTDTASVSHTTVQHNRIQRTEERIEAIQRRIPLRTLFVTLAVLLAVIVFFCARSEGVKQGQRDAREKIEAENDLTAGPNNLLQ